MDSKAYQRFLYYKRLHSIDVEGGARTIRVCLTDCKIIWYYEKYIHPSYKQSKISNPLENTFCSLGDRHDKSCNWPHMLPLKRIIQLVHRIPVISLNNLSN